MTFYHGVALSAQHPSLIHFIEVLAEKICFDLLNFASHQVIEPLPSQMQCRLFLPRRVPSDTSSRDSKLPDLLEFATSLENVEDQIGVSEELVTRESKLDIPSWHCLKSSFRSAVRH